ncbi:MAG: urate hydroxylase PuuD, partial [Pseudomonadota bacterium]|nr:urate hydroxylase PuuD [Pseudomonadota bacterium]
MAYLLDVLFRYAHIVFGVTWIGLLYYFNFVQTEYIKEAEDAGKADVMAKLAPRALWWFRWAAMFTFLTGLVLLWWVSSQQRYNLGISLGALMGTLMMLNVWLIIWPNQKIVIGLAQGDKAAAGPKAGLASRTNTLFSLPMLYFMVASIHGLAASGGTWGAETSMPALIIGLV